MNPLQVAIVRLDAMQVAAFHGFGAEPEHQAAARLVAWARPRGLLDAGLQHRVFGFNNPSPTAGSPNYGYEFWLELTPAEAETLAGDVVGSQGELKSFAGGLYAVTRCRGAAAIPNAWRDLVTWCEDSPYAFATAQCLEQHTGALDGPVEEMEFALHQAIVA